MNMLKDAAVREQVTQNIEVSIALSAGAGSGKTSVLTARLVEILASGIHPAKIAAITFTEKAASELQGRVRDHLEIQLANPAAMDSQRLANMRRALNDFSELTLSTLHAFCRKLLLDEALAARFAPATDVAPTEEIAGLQKECVVRWQNAFAERHCALAPVVKSLTSQSSLEESGALLAHYRHYDLVTSKDSFEFNNAHQELAALLKNLKHAARSCLDPENCKLLAKSKSLFDFLENALCLDAERAVCNALLSKKMVLKPGKTGRKGDWPGTTKDEFLEVLSSGLKWQVKWRGRLHHVVVHELRDHFVPAFAAEKQNAGILTFDDLLLRAAHLLRTRAEARMRLSAKFKCVLIDEVQDTDPMQAEVATLLTRALKEHGIWYDSTPEAGRLFAVGDCKQSIYRFRGADVGTFGRIQEVIRRDGQLHELTQNFRSVPGIVHWINATFAGLDGYHAQIPFRNAAELDPVVFLPVFKKQDDEEQKPIRDDETDCMLRHLQDLFSRGAKTIDRTSGKLRLLHAGDVMVLLPSWNKAEEVAASIRLAGLPCNVEGGNLFYKRDEVRLSLAALLALEEPSDAESIVFALRGLFGISMEELAAHTQAEGNWRFSLAQPPGPIADAFSLFRRIRKYRSKIGLGEMLDRLLEGSRALAVWSLLPDGAARVANVEKLKALLTDAEEGSTSPAEALRILLLQAKTQKDERDLSLVDKDAKAIRITTLFKAKGLEAPVVFLVHAHRKTTSSSAFIDHEKHRIALKLKELEPPLWADFNALEAAADTEERRRWMYVAATRARDQLVIVGGEKTGFNSKTGLFQWDLKTGLPALESLYDKAVHETVYEVGKEQGEISKVRIRISSMINEVSYEKKAFPDVQPEVEAALGHPLDGARGKIASGDVLGDVLGDARGDVLGDVLGDARGDVLGDVLGEERQTLLRQNIRRAAKESVKWRSVSEEVARKRMPNRILAAEDAESSSALRVGATGGTVVHQVLEYLDLEKPVEALEKDAKKWVEVLSKKAFLSEEKEADCQEIVAKILRDPVMQEIRNAPFHWKESPFAYQKGKNTIITGTIDLCFPLDASLQKWKVVDWKSHVPKEGSALRQRYEAQLKHYTQALLETAVPESCALDIESILVGPYEQFEDASTLGESLALLDDVVLISGIENISQQAIAENQPAAIEPAIYATVGDPAIADLWVAWEEVKIGIACGLLEEERAALKKEGWQVYDLDDGNAFDALAFVSSALGLAPTPNLVDPFMADKK